MNTLARTTKVEVIYTTSIFHGGLFIDSSTKGQLYSLISKNRRILFTREYNYTCFESNTVNSILYIIFTLSIQPN